MGVWVIWSKIVGELNIKDMNFENYPIGTKIQSNDSHGYPVMEASGYIAKHLGGGHAIIKDFTGTFWSTVGLRKNRVKEIEILK